MVKNISHIVHVHRKYGSLYMLANKAVIKEGHQYIGASVNGKRAIMLNDVELESYMPSILGVTSKSVEYLPKLNHHWDSLAVFVPEHGLGLEIGILYDVDSPTFEANIKALSTKIEQKFSTSEALAEYVEANIDHKYKWKYGTPINAENYSVWRYCENYGDIANKVEDVEKSTRIRFYIHDDTIVNIVKQKAFDLRNRAAATYIEIISKPDMVETMLYAVGFGEAAKDKNNIEKAQLLETAKDNNPEGFISISKDSQLKEIAYIEKLIAYGFLTRDIDTKHISEAKEGLIIGKNAKQATAFLKEEKNIKLANELNGMLKTS